jgi:hypothetical protein
MEKSQSRSIGPALPGHCSSLDPPSIYIPLPVVSVDEVFPLFAVDRLHRLDLPVKVLNRGLLYVSRWWTVN